MKTTRLLIASVCLVLACRRDDASQEASSAPANVTLDEQLVEVARLVPGFGGMYFDEDGNLNVFMVEDPKALAPDALDARRAQLEKAVLQVYGADFLAQGRARRSEERQEQVTVTPSAVRIVKADYDILQLASWRAKVDRALGVPNVVFTDLDERSNRLKIGIGPGATRDQVEAAIKESGVPREAILIEETQPIYPHSGLRDKVRPVPGGVQGEADTGVTAYKICTMGFNAIRGTISGFVTNSHCTKTQGGSNGTDFHQPNDPYLSEGNKVGDEIADPTYFTGGACPAGRRCRFSDSAFIDYTVARGSNIARTTGWNNGLLTISSTNPRLRIVGEMSSWVAGSDLDKIGRTTGWTFGLVNATCQNTNVAGTDITLFCQHRVNRLASQTQKMSDNGDSGSPVFRYQGLTVLLSGILWGGPNDGSSFVFSPINQVEQELGALTTFNFPQPQPTGGMCPSGQKCCEIEMINNKPKCVLCVPTGEQCP